MIAVLITTVFLAAVYSLVALGLSLTWAGLGFLNLAHGQLDINAFGHDINVGQGVRDRLERTDGNAEREAALLMLQEEGLENVFARHARHAAGTSLV